MKTYIITFTHNEWTGSLERIIQAKDIEHAKATINQWLLKGGRLNEYVINIIPSTNTQYFNSSLIK